MWPIGEALVQSFCSPFFFTQFIAHELLYLYIFRACTISKLRILTGTFSHTRGAEKAKPTPKNAAPHGRWQANDFEKEMVTRPRLCSRHGAVPTGRPLRHTSKA